jgi:hypothetical protein
MARRPGGGLYAEERFLVPEKSQDLAPDASGRASRATAPLASLRSSRNSAARPTQILDKIRRLLKTSMNYSAFLLFGFQIQQKSALRLFASTKSRGGIHRPAGSGWDCCSGLQGAVFFSSMFRREMQLVAIAWKLCRSAYWVPVQEVIRTEMIGCILAGDREGKMGILVYPRPSSLLLPRHD